MSLSHQQKCQILARNPKYLQESGKSITNQTRHSMVVKPNGQKNQLELNDSHLVKTQNT